MRSSDIDEAAVTQAALALDLTFDAAHLAGVLLYYRMLADFASLVGDFPLDVDDEPAPVFTPCSTPTAE
jgi:hypothetical protein